MIILLALYPIVFLFSFFVQAPLLIHREMPFWLALFVGLVVSTTLLSWLAVPFLSKVFHWWLTPQKPAAPAQRTPRRITWAGAALILCLYALLFLIFSRFPW